MASGDVVGLIHGLSPPGGSNRASLATWTGGTTTDSGGAENMPVLEFDDATDEYMDFICSLEGYGGGGVNVTFCWGSDSQTSGNVEWNVAFRRLDDEGEDYNSTDHSYSYQNTSEATATTAGQITYTPVALSNGAQMDSVADGERFIMRVYRDTSTASDMTGDALMLWKQTLITEQ